MFEAVMSPVAANVAAADGARREETDRSTPAVLAPPATTLNDTDAVAEAVAAVLFVALGAS